MENKQDTAKLLEKHLLSQQLQNIQQQIMSLDHQITELENLSLDLSTLRDQDNSKTFSPLGGGIYVETEIKKSDSVLLNVGSNILVKKSREDAQRLVKQQIKQLKNIKTQLEAELNKLSLNLISLK
jgi:prefoldin alpha subunit